MSALTARDATGERYGNLVVERRVENVGHEGRWLCKCDCGGFRTLTLSRLRREHVQPMCRRCERLRAGAKYRKYDTHVDESPEYRIWIGIRARCVNATDPHFGAYGGRGITVCDRWAESFSAFIADMGTRPTPDHSIGRINNDAGYEPANCRWETAYQQANNRRNNHRVEVHGRSLTVTEWAKALHLPVSTLVSRLSTARRRGIDERIRLEQMLVQDLRL